ncbi:MAG: DUF2721 domain-containing protein [Planctomycetes bacterium]|nr:DUF2721 domain-containing protein [Planctomycetota bacterium]MBI3834245.1 DUF2721 domain-containing protein [Planctomycetota bacterium]
MDTTTITQSPFVALTFVAAPALLTNASSVLALSTINRMLRTHDRMHEMFAKSQSPAESESDANRMIAQVNRIERQATLLLRALHAIYTALAAFACATLVTLLGAALSSFESGVGERLFAAIGIVIGFIGVGGLVFGCVNLFQATRLSLVNIRDEAAVIRTRRSTSELHKQ